MIIDAHHHLLRDDTYVYRLADAAASAGVDKVCVFGAGRLAVADGFADNAEVLQAARAHPDLLIGFAVFELGRDDPALIDHYADQGFRGIKFIRPADNYDSKNFYPVYERMEERGLPALFHLGIVARTANDRLMDVNNNRHRPIYLDTLARAFPGMTLIGAHLGNPWYEEAAMSCRWNPNLYFDLTGSTLTKKTATDLARVLWWTPGSRYRSPCGRHAWDKIVFGSDVSAEKISDVLDDYRRVMAELGLAPETQANVLGGTMARILKLT